MIKRNVSYPTEENVDYNETSHIISMIILWKIYIHKYI